MAVTMRQMLEAGVHFGHQTRFWNPKMAPFIFGHRNKIHIINLEKTLPMYNDALKYARQLAANRGTILFVGTKRQSRDTIAEEAKRAGMPYVNARWLGGMLTNFKTLKVSIKRLKDMEAALEAGETERMSKKEALLFEREMAKLQKSIGGVKDMGGIPDAIFVVDVGYHKIAVTEANKLGVPVIAVVDTNHSPIGIDYVIPGNDDASKAVALYTAGVADAILEGRANAVNEVVQAARGGDGDEFVEVNPEAEQMMAAITASMVAELRAKTDAPMMECKKALTEADGDMARAEELLRVKLGNKASKAASRVTAEGVVASFIGGSAGSLVELNCETDFVSKNDDFLAFSKTVAELVATQNPADVAALSALPLDGSTVDAVRLALVGKIGENLSIRRFVRFETSNKLAAYLHGTRIGVLVEYTGADEQVGKDVAMHIAAMKPVSLSSDDVPADLIAKERSIAEQKAAESGKPAEIVAKMVDGSVQKYLKEVSLLNQTFVKNDKQTIEQMLKAGNASVQKFALFVVGEGIEKKQDDFAAEVAAQVAAAKQQ